MVLKNGRSLYLDMQATTPVDPRVLDAMLPWLTDCYGICLNINNFFLGNAHSRTHMYGWEAMEAVEEARKVRLSFE